MRGRIKGLDGLRAISICFVLLTHIGLYDATGLIHYEKWYSLVSGSAGVQIFFVLSGFLITNLMLKEYAIRGTFSIKEFYIRRALRILPNYIFFLITISILRMTNVVSLPMMSLLAAIFYFTNFVSRPYNTGELGHTWSLAVEEHFYLFWPVAFLFLRRKTLLLFAIGIVFLCVYLRVYLVGVPGLEGRFLINRWTLPAAESIMMGCIFAIIIDEYPRSLSLLRQVITLIVALSAYLTSLWLPGTFSAIEPAVRSLGVALLIIWIATNSESVITYVLESRPLSFIGKLSYSLYVWQGLFLRTGPDGTIWIQQLPQSIVLTIVIASLSYFVIERPFLRLKDRANPLSRGSSGNRSDLESLHETEVPTVIGQVVVKRAEL